MSKQILLNFFDEQGNSKLEAFIAEDYPSQEEVEIFKQAEKVELHTDRDYENLFTKVASETRPNNWSELKDTVQTTFQGKLDPQFDRWETKMALDKTALKKMFKEAGAKGFVKDLFNKK
ncbi:hypothetical protein H8D85_01585 [bacterium]|nr:hypothetical protein [bacterium]